MCVHSHQTLVIYLTATEQVSRQTCSTSLSAGVFWVGGTGRQEEVGEVDWSLRCEVYAFLEEVPSWSVAKEFDSMAVRDPSSSPPLGRRHEEWWR